MEVTPGYKQTEVGVIPEDWEVKPAREISNPVRGGSPRPAGDPRFFNGSYIPWLTVAALTNIPESRMVVSETASHLTEDGSLRSRTLLPGTLIIANSGATLGVAKLLGIKCCANDGIAALLNLSKSVSPTYLVHYINTKTRYLREFVASGNGQPNLNTELIGNFKFPLPPTKAEQEAIAETLSDVDLLIESLDHLVAKKRKIKQGAMQELLTGQKRLPGFTDDWETKPLGVLGAFLKGSGVTKSQTLSGDIPCVRYGEIYTRHVNLIREFYSWISREVAQTATRLKRGDILFAGSGETKEEIGKCVAFVHEIEAYAGGDIVILRTECADPLFLGYYLNTIEIARQKASRGQGDAVVHISASALSDIRGKIPKKDEQQAIASILSDMDAEIIALEAKLTKVRGLKLGMMQELLTGQIRLGTSTPATVM
jgi:type I restriction enzyme, S subunit